MTWFATAGSCCSSTGAGGGVRLRSDGIIFLHDDSSMRHCHQNKEPYYSETPSRAKIVLIQELCDIQYHAIQRYHQENQVYVNLCAE